MENGRSVNQNRLAKERDEQPDYAIQLYLIEVETLAANKHEDRAWSVLDKALKQYPDDLQPALHPCHAGEKTQRPGADGA